MEEETPAMKEEKLEEKEEKLEEKEEKPEEKEEIPAEKEMNPVEEETPMEEDPPFLAEVLDTVLSSREIAFLRHSVAPAVIVLFLLCLVTAIALRSQNATSPDNTHAAQKDEVQ